MAVFRKPGEGARTRARGPCKLRHERRYRPEGVESHRLETRNLLTLTATTFPIPLVELVEPTGITTGPDGNLWFIESGAGRIGRMTPGGILTEFPVPAMPPADLPPGAPDSQGLESIVGGPDGALWFTGIPGEVGRISTSGVVSEYPVPSVPPPAGSPAGTPNSPATLTAIAVGSDGALWFTGVPGEVGRITTSGVVTEFPVPASPPPAGSALGTAGSPVTLQAIVAGPDGALWFAGEPGEIGRITTSGVVTEFPVPATPSAIAAGPDGAVWFTGVTGEVGRITTSGVVTEFTVPTVPAPAGQPDMTEVTPNPQTIITGPDGNLWFTTANYGNTDQPTVTIGRVTPSGEFTVFDVPGNFDVLTGLTAGPDGNIWFTERESGSSTWGVQPAVGEITPAGVSTLHALPQGTTLDPNRGLAVDPTAITTGPDGALWFGENGAIGRITTDGTIQQFPLATPAATVAAITSGPGDTVWFAQQVTDANGDDTWSIGRITTSGTITVYPLRSALGGVGGITEGPDGNLWFTANSKTLRIGRITPRGRIKTFDVPVGKTAAHGSPGLGEIMPGPDGRLWFMGSSGSDAGCLCSGNQVPLLGLFGQITTRGSIHVSDWLEASVGQGNYPAYASFAPGSDGKLWYFNNGGRAGVQTGTGIIRISTSGAASPALPVDNISSNLVRLPNGQVWFTTEGPGAGLATRSGIVVTQDLPGLNISNNGSSSNGYGVGNNMTVGPDGNLWLVTGNSTVVRISGLDTPLGSLDYRHRAQRAPDYAYDPSTTVDQWTNVTSNAHPTFAGVASPGAEVTLWAQKQGETQPVSIGRVKASKSDGSWTLKSDVKLSDGNYAVTLTQTGDTGPPSVLYSLQPDSAGNLSDALVIDTAQAGRGTSGRAAKS